MQGLGRLKFDQKGVIPVTIQDAADGQVLMMGHMTKEALTKTIESGNVYLWSRRKEKIWKKGDRSGNVQNIQQIFTDCDGDSLLIVVEQIGHACHEGFHSCFHRQLQIGNRWEVTAPRIADPVKRKKAKKLVRRSPGSSRQSSSSNHSERSNNSNHSSRTHQ